MEYISYIIQSPFNVGLLLIGVFVTLMIGSILLELIKMIFTNIWMNVNGIGSLMRKVPWVPTKNNFTFYFFGNLLDIVPGQFVFQLAKASQELFGEGTNFGLWFFQRPAIIVTDPNDVSFILGKGQQNFEKPQNMPKAFKFFLGNSMLSSNGERWKKQRHVFNPAFHFDVVSNMSGVIISRTKILTEIIEESIQNDSTLDMAIQMQNLTQDVLGLVGFSFDFDAQRDKTNKYRKAFLDCLHYTRDFTRRNIVPILFRLIIPSYRANSIQAHASRQLLIDSVRSILSQRLDKNGNVKESSKNIRDLLGFMLAARTEGQAPDQWPNQDDMINEMMLFLFAGSDTTSYLLASAIYLLSINKACATKVYEEIDSVCGSPDNIPSPQTVLNNLPYLNSFIRETLRLYPSAPIVAREPNQKVTLPSGTQVMPGIELLVSPYIIHHQQSVWGENANQFDPDRWTKETPNDGPVKCSISTAFIPFVAGQRNCIGQNLARLESSLVLAMLCQRYEFSYVHTDPDRSIEQGPARHGAITMHFTKGLNIQFKRRSQTQNQ